MHLFSCPPRSLMAQKDRPFAQKSQENACIKGGCTHFTRFVPTLLVVAGYWCAFYFLTLVLDTIPVGVTYAIWSGLGIVLVTIVAAVLYRQVPDWPAIAGMSLIIAGVVVINLFSESTGH